jgi:hypothetical protein
MLTKTTEQMLFQVMSDDMFLLSEAVSQNERFWEGEMIEAPVDVNGWRLIPADQYEYSIPAEAVERVLHLVNSGVKLKGVVIADDVRSPQIKKNQPAPRHTRQTVQPKPEPTPIEFDWDAAGKVLKVLGLMGLAVAAVVTMSWLLAALVTIGTGLLVATLIIGALAFDPKLIVLISDGDGGTIWVSLYTWYDTPS